MGMDWTGGDIVRYPGGGQKINLLKPVVEKWKDEKNMIVMFVDRYHLLTQYMHHTCTYSYIHSIYVYTHAILLHTIPSVSHYCSL